MLVHFDEVANGEAGACRRSSLGLLSSCGSDFEGSGRIQFDIQPYGLNLAGCVGTLQHSRSRPAILPMTSEV
jgi:hypothetical protein